MAWYVFALVDAVPSGRPGTGLPGPLATRKVAGAFAVVEHRADVPPAEFGSLQRHQDIVAQLAARVPALLPVRFGTLLDDDALDEALQERDEDLAEALEAVRGRVQFTWRRKAAAVRRGAAAARVKDARSGAAYLRRAARAARTPPPAAWRQVRAKVVRLISAERYQPASDAAPESLYHLVDRDKAARYTTAAAAIRRAQPQFIVTGPWPAFAFAPELL